MNLCEKMDAASAGSLHFDPVLDVNGREVHLAILG